MTAIVRRAQATPMAPYLGVMKEMNASDKNAIINFLMDSLRMEEEAKRPTEAKSNIDRESTSKLPASFRRLRGMGHLTLEDAAQDDRLKYILSK